MAEREQAEATAQEAASPSDALAQEMSGLEIDEKVKLCWSFAQEITQEEELRNLFAKKPNAVAYDGFEPSGRMHIAQGVMKALNVNKLAKCGVHFKFWVADWFAQLNNKMGGDLKKIRVVGEYMIEVWKAVGMDLSSVEFLWASDEINKRSAEYWTLVMDVAMKNNLKRIVRCSQIMGRGETEDLSAAQIFYPCMQCADIFFLKADICQLGLDQRKVNMLAREYCDSIKRKLKPIIISHPMLPGLKEGQEKMSKSDPESAIFMEDTAEDVRIKIKKAYCPPQVVDGNPVVAYVRHIILPWQGHLTISRSDENGGNRKYETMEDLEADFASGVLHPADLKAAVTGQLNEILQPVRDHFKNDKHAADLLKRVKQFKTTR